MKLVLVFCLLILSAPAFAEARVPQSAAQIQLSFAPLVKEAAPAVVNIYAKRISRTRQRTPFAGDPFFDRFFQDFGPARPRVQNSLGSGVILSADGIVVSNYHVVGEATEIRVVLNDRREFDATVLLGDEESDLAILRISGAEDLPFLSLRDSDTVEVGELVLAIGNPFGVGQTVSSGIVSGLARSGGTNGGGRGYFIQTDAPINPGNSGGALIDVSGALIGINTRILTRSGGSNGIGFAIPANLVAAFVAQAEAGHTRFRRPWAGLSGQAVSRELVEALGLARPSGVILSGIHPLSPFAEAFAVGDVITAVGGAAVNTPPEIVYHMSVAGEGARIRVSRLRAGTASDVEVTLIAAPDTPARDAVTLPRTAYLPGLTLWRINPAVADELGLALEAEGVVVADPGDLGRRAGFRPGDIIRSVDRRPVASPRAAADLLSARGRKAVTVQRGAQRLFLRF